MHQRTPQCPGPFVRRRSESKTLTRSVQNGHTKDREDGGGDAVGQPYRYPMNVRCPANLVELSAGLPQGYSAPKPIATPGCFSTGADG
jgi:hypothetical protein